MMRQKARWYSVDATREISFKTDAFVGCGSSLGPMLRRKKESSFVGVNGVLAKLACKSLWRLLSWWPLRNLEASEVTVGSISIGLEIL